MSSKKIKCPVCDKTMSSSAWKCPNCGEPSKDAKAIKTIIGIAIVIIAVIANIAYFM